MSPSKSIEWDRLRALLEAYLKADFFGGSPRRQAGSALTTGALFQASLSVGAGALLFMGLPPFELLVAGLTFVATLTVLVLGPEASELLRLDDGRLAGLPVTRTTAGAARALHAATYVVLGTSAAAIPIATYVGVALGSVSAGIATYLAALQQTLVLAALAAGLEGCLARSALGLRARPLVSFLLGVLLVAALLAGVRPMPELGRAIRDAGTLLLGFPPAWFAGEVLAAAGVATAIPSQLSGLPLLALLGSAGALALGFLGSAHGPARAAGVAAPPSSLRRRVAERCVAADERATFDFTLDTISRESELALRAAPIFAFPAALLVVGAAVEDPKERGLFVHVLLFVANAYLPAAVLLLSRSSHARARWLFDTAPITRPERLRSGVFKAAIAVLALPLWLALVVTDAVIRGPATAALHAPIVGIVGWLVLDRAVAQLPDPFPFGRERERLGGDAGEGVIGLAVGLTILGFLEAWLVTSIPAALAATAIGVAWLALQRRLRLRRAAP